MGSYGVQVERRFWVWAGYLSKYFCRERILYMCVFSRARWMDACARWDWDCYIGLYVWIGCFGIDFTGETKEVIDDENRNGRIGYHVSEVEK
jgi:hypothetical protein